MKVRLLRKIACVMITAFAALAVGLIGVASAETKEVRLAQQFGIGYLPLMMMRHENLIQKHAEKAGLGDIKVVWSTYGGGAAMNSALLSGNLDFASGGVGPLLKIWDKTKGIYDAHGVGALNTMPLFLNTTSDDVQSVKDFTDDDRIALPAVKVSIQAVTLQMAVAQALGQDNFDKLDGITVSMKHPDGMAALLSGGSEITGHFTSPPYSYLEAEDPNIHTVLTSYDVLGGPSTFNTLWTTTNFRTENPKTYDAVFAALEEAMTLINEDKRRAAEVYVEQADSKMAVDKVYEIITKPGLEFTVVPNNVMGYAKFMHETGAIDTMPDSWKALFFEELHDVDGS